ncbi:unnamed protein product [Pleuronectes platessa]|uniref:Uncharacterized protein n=1 Tax=Pleuronectes platessa TaxID=8262 RepID=A0A9N7YHG2_PLEPL|nr:unnamed protein product [Pleuronectes platessa]
MSYTFLYAVKFDVIKRNAEQRPCESIERDHNALCFCVFRRSVPALLRSVRLPACVHCFICFVYSRCGDVMCERKKPSESPPSRGGVQVSVSPCAFDDPLYRSLAKKKFHGLAQRSALEKGFEFGLNRRTQRSKLIRSLRHIRSPSVLSVYGTQTVKTANKLKVTLAGAPEHSSYFPFSPIITLQITLGIKNPALICEHVWGAGRTVTALPCTLSTGSECEDCEETIKEKPAE